MITSPLPRAKTSPTTRTKEQTVDTQETMDFPDAMRLVIAGHKVTKLEWDNPDVIVYLDGRLRIRLEDGVVHDLIVSDGDMLGTDWVIAD